MCITLQRKRRGALCVDACDLPWTSPKTTKDMCTEGYETRTQQEDVKRLGNPFKRRSKAHPNEDWRIITKEPKQRLAVEQTPEKGWK